MQDLKVDPLHDARIKRYSLRRHLKGPADVDWGDLENKSMFPVRIRGGATWDPRTSVPVEDVPRHMRRR